MIAVALAGLLVSRLRGTLPSSKTLLVDSAGADSAVAVLFLQLPISLPVWNLLPKLRFLQFPWRWLVVLEAPMAIFLAARPSGLHGAGGGVAVAAACAAVFLA
jgi:hypothetical protein